MASDASDYTSSYTGAEIDEGLARARNEEALVQDQVKADTDGSLILSDDSGNGLTVLDGGNVSITDGKVLMTDSVRAKDAAGITLTDSSARGLAVNDGGIVTNAYQPCFLVRPATDQTNIAVGSNVTVVFGNEIKDIGSNFSSNTFTAPAGGMYLLSLFLRIDDVDSASNFYFIRIVTSNRNYQNTFSTDQFNGDLGYLVLNVAVVADMDESDTAYVTVFQNNGTQQSDIKQDTTFSGALIA